MAVTITSGPADWSISAENGRKWAEWQYSGHPPLNRWTILKYKVTGTGDLIGSSEETIGECQGSEHLPCDFNVGTWSVHLEVWTDPEHQQIAEGDFERYESGELTFDEPERLEKSNTWTFTVSA